MAERSVAARLCWAIDRNEWIIATGNILAAVVFVGGCVAFYFPSLYTAGVSLFLAGSLLWLGAGVADTYRRHGPSC